MAYRSDKPKKKLNKAEQHELARQQWEAYTRARDNGHQDYSRFQAVTRTLKARPNSRS